jgi:hypothetical protein
MASLYKKPVFIREPRTGKREKTKSKKWWGRFRDAMGQEKRRALGAAVTHDRSSMPPVWCLPTIELLDASLPIPRVLAGRVPRLPRYYQGTATSCHPSRRTSFPSLGGTTGTRPLRSRRRGVWTASSLGLVARYPRPGLLPWRRQDLPSSWGTPIPVCSCSPTPAGRCVPDQLRNARAAPAKGTTKAPTMSDFRGSIAWLSG